MLVQFQYLISTWLKPGEREPDSHLNRFNGFAEKPLKRLIISSSIAPNERKFQTEYHIPDRDLDHDHMPASLDIAFVAVPESSHELQKAKQEHLRVSMSESESAITDSQPAPAASENEEITYQAVEKDGVVTAIWEMKGRKHLRTIDPRSRQGREILNLYTTEDVEHPATSEAATP